MIDKSLNPFRISLGNRRVYTIFAIEPKNARVTPAGRVSAAGISGSVVGSVIRRARISPPSVVGCCERSQPAPWTPATTP